MAAVALSLLGLAALFHLFDASQGVAGFVLRGYKSTFWPMVIYGVALWGIGLGGGYWIGLNATPFGPPRGPLGFWEAATAALALAADPAVPSRGRRFPEARGARLKKKGRETRPFLSRGQFAVSGPSPAAPRCAARSAGGSRTAPSCRPGGC